jgi:glycosyltransferase involved in cell wall biosynthesis
MRVVFVTHAPRDPHAAVFAYVTQRAAALERGGHEAHIVTPENFPRISRTSARYRPLTYAVASARLLLAGPAPDVVIFHSWSGWAFSLVRRLRPRIRCLTQFHGIEPLYYGRVKAEMARLGRPFPLRHRAAQALVMPALLRASCRRSDAVLCLNLEERRFLVKQGYARAEKVHVIPNAVDRRFLEVEPADRRGGAIAFVGQWLEAKGTDPLVKGFVDLARRNPQAELWCIGTRTAAEVVGAGFPEDVRARVHVQPEATPDAIASRLARSDVFVLPSVSEGFSVALLEAMAAGCAIVTTRVGAAPDALVEGASALFIPAGDAAALAAAVERLLEDAALRARLSRAARAAAQPYARERLEPLYVRFLEDFAP